MVDTYCPPFTSLLKEETIATLSYLMPRLRLRLMRTPLWNQFDEVELLMGDPEIAEFVVSAFIKGEIIGRSEAIEAEAKPVPVTIRAPHPMIKLLAAEALAEGETKGKADRLRELILNFMNCSFPIDVLEKVKQAIDPILDVEKLREFHCRVAQTSDGKEIVSLLSHFFPPQGSLEEEEAAESLRQSILIIANRYFSSRIVSMIQQAIDPVKNLSQLKEFCRQLIQIVVGDQEIQELLTLCFPAV